MPAPEKVAVFLHSGEYDRVHQGLSIAAAAVATGRQADVFFFWWALERLANDGLDEPDLRDDVGRRFEARGMPTLRQLLQHLRESKRCTLYACTGSMAAVADSPVALEGKVDRFVGWATILSLVAGTADRFYL